MKQFFKKIGDLSLPLILGIITALCWANMDTESYTKVIYGKIFSDIDLHFLVNDVFLVFFFGFVCVEIVKGVAPGGNLYPIKNTVSNLLGALGGVILPIIIFFILNFLLGSPTYTHGWAVPTATDVAISLLFAQIIFGKTHPAFTFLLLLAIADDVIGLIIIALFYPDPELPVELNWLFLVLVAMFIAYSLNRAKVKNYLLYLLVGTISWYGLFKANIHPSLALIFIIPFIPHYYNQEKKSKQSSLDLFEHDFKYLVDYGMFFFGLSNAGVVFTSISVLTLIIFIALLLGKTCGIYAMVKVSGLMGFKINKHIANRDLFVLSMTAGVGLTVSLFIAEIAYTNVAIGDAAKMGALFSLGNGFIAIIVAKLIGCPTHTKRKSLFFQDL